MTDKPKLTRRRVLGGIGTIGIAGALGTGTYALFQDEESTGPLDLAAGELDLFVDYYGGLDQGDITPDDNTVSGTIDGDNQQGFDFSVTDIKPGDSGTVAFCPKIVNNPAYLYVGSETGVTEEENGQTEPESIVDDTSGGELAENIQVTVSLASSVSIDGGEVNCDVTRELNNPDDYTLADLGGELQSGFLIEPDPAQGTDVPYPASDNSDTQNGPCLCVDLEVPMDVGNIIQTDSVELNLSFVAVQSRHNDDPTNPFSSGSGTTTGT